MNEREQLAKDNGMTIEFVNWFFDNKKDGCGNVWFMMMAAMCEGWSGREAKCAALAAELEAAEKRVAELEAREVVLPKRYSMLHRDNFDEPYHTEFVYKQHQVLEALHDAGIGIKGE